MDYEEFKQLSMCKRFAAQMKVACAIYFNDPDNDLTIDFWKRNVGVDVAFNHRSFIGGDLLRLQAGAEVMNVIKLGVYICPTKTFSKLVSPKDSSSMVNFERTRWFLESFYSVFTVPILLIGLRE